MIDLTPFAALVPLDHGLCVAVTRRPDHTPHATVVNAGVAAHPVAGHPVVAFVAAGTTRKVAHLRADSTITVVVRSSWRWASVEGHAELIGPDDPYPGVEVDRLRWLLREIFTSAGGTHDDWDTYDRVMRDGRRAAVLVTATRLYTNPG